MKFILYYARQRNHMIPDSKRQRGVFNLLLWRLKSGLFYNKLRLIGKFTIQSPQCCENITKYILQICNHDCKVANRIVA